MSHPFKKRFEILCLLNSEVLSPHLQKRIKILGMKLQDIECLQEKNQKELLNLIEKELLELESYFPILSNEFNTLTLLN